MILRKFLYLVEFEPSDSYKRILTKKQQQYLKNIFTYIYIILYKMTYFILSFY